MATAAYGQGRACETAVREVPPGGRPRMPVSSSDLKCTGGGCPFGPRRPPGAHGASPLKEVPRGGNRWSPERRGSSRPRGPPGEMTAREAGDQKRFPFRGTWFPQDAEGEGAAVGTGAGASRKQDWPGRCEDVSRFAGVVGRRAASATEEHGNGLGSSKGAGVGSQKPGATKPGSRPQGVLTGHLFPLGTVSTTESRAAAIGSTCGGTGWLLARHRGEEGGGLDVWPRVKSW